MSGANAVYLRRIDPEASPPVLVAARLVAEFGTGHRVRLIDGPTLLCVTSSDSDLGERIAEMLAQSRFDGWVVIDTPASCVPVRPTS